VNTIRLDVPGWAGHLPGQHVDVRLTAEDGYQAQRSYSIASAPAEPALELTRAAGRSCSSPAAPASVAQHAMPARAPTSRRRCSSRHAAGMTSSIATSSSG
jgi:hypothetical protein